MRFNNTSFIKNAISIFASEANDVLRAIAFGNPATNLLRLLQSYVRTVIQLVQRFSRGPLQGNLQTTGYPGTLSTLATSVIGRTFGMSGGSVEQMPGRNRWDCRLSHTGS